MRSSLINKASTLDAWLFGDDNETNEGKSSSSDAKSSQVHPSYMSSTQQRTKQHGSPSEPLSTPFPVSSRLRKFFTPSVHTSGVSTSLQKSRAAATKAAVNLKDAFVLQPQRQHQQARAKAAVASFAKLQGHVPFTLKEILSDPKKLPYLLRWLKTETDPNDTNQGTNNYHQVLLFLLEIEQLQLVTQETRKEHALKIWSKFIDSSKSSELNEFCISSTLELTRELEELALSEIEDKSKAHLAFFPIQKLAYSRLSKEEMPRFVKSTEYLAMLVDTENDLSIQSVPMERILEQPRAAHYFLLFLMQSRQHFELYFWLHVEFVLRPLLATETRNLNLFWQLARVLISKAQDDSQAITLATKNDLYIASEGSIEAALASFSKAQMEIFVMLRSSWYDRFMKSELYKMMLKDSLLHFEVRRETNEKDSPPKWMTRSKSEAKDSTLQEYERTVEDEEVESEEDEENEEHEEQEESKLMLDLESIIRRTKLPDGLQVHYRPYSDSIAGGTNTAVENAKTVESILTFATFVEKEAGKEEPTWSLQLTPIKKNVDIVGSVDDHDITRRVRPFIVPNDDILIRPAIHTTTSQSRFNKRSKNKPKDAVFSFLQSGRDGFLYGVVYLTYETVRVDQESMFAAKGICILSRKPLVHGLRSLLSKHIHEAEHPSDVFCPERLGLLMQSEINPGEWKNSDVDIESSAQVDHTLHLPLDFLSRSTLLDLSGINCPIDISLEPLFQHLGTSLTLQLLGSALLECSIVLIASQYSLLTSAAEAIRCLLKPFSWCHVYAPVLPSSLKSYLQCPTPICVGMHCSMSDRADLPTKGFYLVVDFERQKLEYLGNQSLEWRNLGLPNVEQMSKTDKLFLPEQFEVAKHTLDKIISPQSTHYDSIDSVRNDPMEFPEYRVRLICYELFSSLLNGHRDACLVVGDSNDSVVIFDETEFLKNLQTENDVDFYRALFRTQCFSEIVSSHSIPLESQRRM